MRDRDYEYIDNRLSAPAVEVLDAILRLRLVGYEAIADEATAHAQTFTDAMREIRHAVQDQRLRDREM